MKWRSFRRTKGEKPWHNEIRCEARHDGLALQDEMLTYTARVMNQPIEDDSEALIAGMCGRRV